MQITVSSGRKIYRRGESGSLDSSSDSFQSQTITIPDDTTDAGVRIIRLSLQKELDTMVDFHQFAQGNISEETMVKRSKNRDRLYSRLSTDL